MASRPAHYRNGHDRKADELRARANPDTRCAHCGLTLAEHPPTKTGKPQTWDADHVLDGVPGSPLQLMAMSCNRELGARLGNRRRAGVVNPQGW